MKITVLTGSPKGPYSISFQFVRYIQKHRPEAEFAVFHVGQQIKAIENNDVLFAEIIAAVKASDCVLWCYPVYYHLVPYQLLKLIDLIFQRGQTDAFASKYAVQLSTSKHVGDHTAYNYVHNICQDLGMRHLRGFWADIGDLMTEKGRHDLLSFADETFGAVRDQTPVTTRFDPAAPSTQTYTPPRDLNVFKSKDYRIVLVTDCTDTDSNLYRMIETYRQALPNDLQVLNITEFPFQGGCMGCLHCTIAGRCIQKDGFDELHRTVVAGADCVIVAASINRHWFNPIWKCYDDRQFYRGHRLIMMGKPIGYIISGPLRQEENLRQILELRGELWRQYLLDIVTDEYDSQEVAALLVNLAARTMWAVETGPQRPVNMFGVGGMKIYRDLVYEMRGLMREDHRFYKQYGFYDFPQGHTGTILKGLALGRLLRMGKNKLKASQIIRDAVYKQYDEIVRRY